MVCDLGEILLYIERWMVKPCDFRVVNMNMQGCGLESGVNTLAARAYQGESQSDSSPIMITRRLQA